MKRLWFIRTNEAECESQSRPTWPALIHNASGPISSDLILYKQLFII
jgi:hypothetical protein